MMAPEASTSRIKQYKPYFTPAEVEQLSAKQRGKLSVSREEKGRLQACGFIDAVGLRCGFPRKTIATAQLLYMRFHLFFPYKDFSYTDVSLSALYVSSKLHDTLKKPREIILASYGIRYPHLVKKGQVDPSAVDPRMLEDERKKVLGIERLVLETMCFKFEVDEVGPYVVKLGRKLGLPVDACQAAWRIAMDSYRTHAPLSFPPHVIALGAIYTCGLLAQKTSIPLTVNAVDSDGPEDPLRRAMSTLSAPGTWERDFSASVSQVDDVAHYLLDLYTALISSHADNTHQPSPVSPKEPIPNPTKASASMPASAYTLSASWTPQTLTELKIHLRDRRPGKSAAVAWVNTPDDGESAAQDPSDGMGKNDGTIRFVWEIAST